MKAIICLAAMDVIRDADSNNISAINILESLSSQGFPFLLQVMAFFASFERTEDEPGDWEGQFRIALDGEELLNRPFAVGFQGQLRTRSIIRLQGLVLPKAGTLTFELDIANGPSPSYSVSIQALAGAPPEVEVVTDA